MQVPASAPLCAAVESPPSRNLSPDAISTPAPRPEALTGEAPYEPRELPPEIDAAWLAYGGAVNRVHRVAWNDVRGFEDALGNAPALLRNAIADALAAVERERDEARAALEGTNAALRGALTDAVAIVGSSPKASIGALHNTHIAQIGVQTVEQWRAALATPAGGQTP